MSINLEIYLPSEEIGFVEYGRAFCIQGNINSDEQIPNNALLTINLINEDNNVVRSIHSNQKNQEIDLFNKDLTCYPDEMDEGRKKLLEFGFPELLKDDNGSINNGSIKLWYSDTKFKGIIISASDIAHGAMLDDGMHFVDDKGNPYSILEKGKYKIEVILSFNNNECKAYKDIVIGEKDKQFICRFNPISHKQRMMDFCKENNISIIADLMPGYLEPYLNTWLYHMGLLKMYRANDICLYRSADVIMFLYLIDQTSTSYATELSYLMANNKLSDTDKFTYYHYDIGEAIINDRQANIIKFDKDEYMYLCRIDVLKDKQEDNIYYLDQRNVKDVIFDLNNVEVNVNDKIAIMGILKPYQLDPNDFILKNDNTYMVNNYPYIIRYELKVDDNTYLIDKQANMERIDDKSIGNSVYEFYNVIEIEKIFSGKTIDVDIKVLDRYGKEMLYKANLKIKVGENHD